MSPRRRVLTAQGAEALDEARATTDLVQEARREVLDLADRRRRAVLRANSGGASYSVIADALGISVAGVQQLIRSAGPGGDTGRARRPPGPRVTGRGDGGGAPRYWTRPMRLDDQLVTDEALDAVVGLGARWPEPRALDQTRVFHLDDRGALSLRLLDQEGVTDLLELLVFLAPDLHEVACCDDEATTSSAMEWALDELGVPPVHALDPRVWLESTELVRWLRARAVLGRASARPSGRCDPKAPRGAAQERLLVLERVAEPPQRLPVPGPQGQPPVVPGGLGERPEDRPVEQPFLSEAPDHGGSARERADDLGRRHQARAVGMSASATGSSAGGSSRPRRADRCRGPYSPDGPFGPVVHAVAWRAGGGRGCGAST